MGTVMRPLARLEPVQQNLPLPPPPWRPFFALAREVPVGNPTSKYVYLVLASYCPIMARAWSAVGRVRRTTLQRVCEFKKIQTLDLHLRALRDAGYADWSRTGRASEFIIRLSPLHILGSLAQPGSTSDGVSDQPPRGLDPPSNGGSGRRPFTSNGHSSPGSGADPPFDGESATSFGDSESPPEGYSVSRRGADGLPPKGGSVTPHAGRFRSPVSRPGVVLEGSQGLPEAAAAAAADSDSGVVHGVGPPSAGSPLRSASAPAGLLDRQVKLLEVASDRLRAVPCPRLWRAARPEALQQQLSAAVRHRERHRERLEWVAHAHEVEGEVLCGYGQIAGTPWMTVVQRCACGSLRVVRQSHSSGFSDLVEWSLCAFVVFYATATGFLQDLADVPDSSEFVVSLADWNTPYSLADVGVLAESGAQPPALVEPSALAADSSVSGVACASCGAVVESAELIDEGCVVCGVVGDGRAPVVDLVPDRVSGGER